MSGKAVTRGRKNGAGNRHKTMPRAATRTGKKTASARAAMPAASKPATVKTPPRKAAALTPSSSKAGAARKPSAGKPQVAPRLDADVELERDAALNVARKDPSPLRTEDDDLDWMTEEDDPRKQIVEDDEEGDTHHDEW